MKSKIRKKINVGKILESNPHINREQYEMIQKQQKELSALGFKRARYNLVSPFMRRIHFNDKNA
jgi:hypothetical protein